MKVETVAITFRPGVNPPGLRDVRVFHEADYPELHYMAKEGQHIVNFKASDGRREGFSYPMSDVKEVHTVL